MSIEKITRLKLIKQSPSIIENRFQEAVFLIRKILPLAHYGSVV